MHPYFRNLVALVLASSSASVVSPSLAQTLGETSNNNINNTGSISSQSISTSQSDLGSYVSSKPVIVPDGTSSANSVKANVAATNDNPRIPISSKIFVAPSMQQ